jgi:diaminopimelate dehydrogenase
MTRRRLAIVGFGRLGGACAHAARERDDVELAGVVRRSGSAAKLPAPLAGIPVVNHLRDLDRVDAALLCVPATETAAAAREILQFRVPIVECAIVEGAPACVHEQAIAAAARLHRVAAVVGAGWDPGAFTLLRRAFELLVPHGVTSITDRPGVLLHHTEAARNVEGVIDALTTEYRDAPGQVTRYVYAELAAGADPARVQAALDADPLFAGERTLLFPVASVARIEEDGHGVLLERRGTARAGVHENILFEARFAVPDFAARVMLDAAARLPYMKPGIHRYALWAGARS